MTTLTFKLNFITSYFMYLNRLDDNNNHNKLFKQCIPYLFNIFRIMEISLYTVTFFLIYEKNNTY